MSLPDIDCAPPEAFPRTILDRVEGSPVTEGDLYDAHGRIDAEAAACQRSHAALAQEAGALAGRFDDELEEVRADIADLAGNARAGLLRVLVIAGGLAVLALLGDVALTIALVVRT